MNREERERRIFQLFVEAAHLPVIPGSVWSAPPPAPDILCEIQSKGSVSFELVEIVTPAFAKGLENSRRMEQAFRGICERYPQIAVRFSDAFIYVGFLEHTTIRQRLSVVHKVVCELGQHSENSWGQIEVPARLERIVSEISVTRGCSYGPVFSVLEMSEHHDEIYIQIEKKCKKKYSTDYSIELLAHYTSQPSPRASIGSQNFMPTFWIFYLGAHSSGCGFMTIGAKKLSMFFPVLQLGGKPNNFQSPFRVGGRLPQPFVRWGCLRLPDVEIVGSIGA